MLIPNQAIPGGAAKPQPKQPSDPLSSLFNAANTAQNVASKAANATRKVKVRTAYGEYEVEHKGKLTRRDVNNYRDMLEAEGIKQGWKRTDGTVADTRLQNATPKQYEDAKKALAPQAKPQPKQEAKPRVDRGTQSRLDAYDQSRLDPTAQQEYTGGDPTLARDTQGRGMNATNKRRLNPTEDQPDASSETKRILQGVEKMVFSNTPGGALRNKASDIVQGITDANQRANVQDPVVSMLGGMAQDALTPIARISSGVGNLYDSSATGQERLGAAGNLLLEGLGVAGSLPGAKAAASVMGNAGSGLVRGLESARLKKLNKILGAPQFEPLSAPSPKVEAFGKSIGVEHSGNFAAYRQGAQNATDVSGVVPQFRQPISKMPESRIESLSPQGRAIESWAGQNLQSLLDKGVGSDLRTWDAVGKHYGAGAVPRNVEDFQLWLNDLVHAVDENDRTVSAMAELHGRGGDFHNDMQSLREAIGKTRKTQPGNSTGVVALVPQGRGYRAIPNSAWIPLSDIPMHLRRSIMDRVGSTETRFTSRGNYQAWVDAGKPEGGVLRPRLADEYMMDSFGGNSTMEDFIMNPPKEAMVPRDAVRAELNRMAATYQRAGEAAAAMRKPVKPQDFESAVKHYNGETVAAPMDVVAPKPVEMKPATQVKTKPPTPPANPILNDIQPVASEPKITGVSNNIQLSKVEQGILKETPVGKGMTNAEFQAKVEEAGRRIDAGEVNPVSVADAIEGGKALDSDSLAVIKAGNRRFEAKTRILQSQLDEAIAAGDDASIVSLQKQVDASRAEHLDYLEKVQKGKSEWSNVGRLMAQGMDVDSDTLTGVVANAERIAGKKFKDIDPNIATKLDEIGTQLEDITKKLDAAQAENKRLQKLIEDGKAPGFKRAEIQVRREKAISNIRSKWVENKPEARISSDPLMAGRTIDELQRLAKIAPDVVELAKTYIAEGADAVADILKRIKKDTDVDLTEDDFNLVLSGEYRQFKSPKVEDAVNFEDVNKAFAKMVNDEKLADLRKQARTAPIAQRSRIQKSIRKLEVQIKQQQLPNARAKAQIDADTQRLIEKRESARVQRDDIYAQLKDKRERELHPTKTFLLELVNAPKSVVLSLDNSAPMTHGAFVLGSHPITWLKATSKSIGAFLKEENRVKALAEIRSDPYFDKAVGAGKVKGLAMRDLNDAAPYSGIVGRIPILGKPFKASDRAMEVFGAKVRLELFKSYAKAEESGWLTRFYKANPDYAAIGEAVNTMTGRGTGKAAEGAGKLFGTVATAPTYTVSRFKLAMGTPFFNAAIRKQPVLAARVVADYAKYVGATVTGLVAAQRYGLEVDWDDSSSNYLKYKIPGTNVWIDPNGGILQPVRLALQMKTKDPAVTGGFFIAGKTSPLPRSMMNLQAGLRGKKQFGKSYDPATPEGKLNLLFQFAPLSIQNMTEIKNEQNLTAEQKTALAIASFFGANVNVKEGTDKK